MSESVPVKHRLAIPTQTILVCAILLAALGVRFIHLDADVPTWFAPSDAGLHVDEGYKTFAARNLAEFGRTNWNAEDDYPGWMQKSALTQCAFYVAFVSLGVELEAARVMSVFWFAALLVSFALVLRKAYPGALIALGAVLLLMEPFLLVVSRTAIFEMPLAFVVGAAHLSVFRLRSRTVVWQVGALGVWAIGASALIKPSAFLYLIPAIGAVTASHLYQTSHRPGRPFIALAFGAVAGTATLLFLTRGYWAPRIDLAALATYHERLLANPIALDSPLVMLCGLMCVFLWLRRQPETLLSDPYRTALVATLLGVPILLAILPHGPARYYPAMMPAVVFLIVEFLAFRETGNHQRRRIPGSALLWLYPVGIAVVWFAAYSVEYAVLRRLPIAIGDDPGISRQAMLGMALPLSILGGLVLAAFSGRVAVERLMNLGVPVVIVVYVSVGVAANWRAIVAPTHQAQEIAQAVSARVPGDASIAGDWAPYIGLRANRAALYVNDVFNRPERFLDLRPDFFLSSGHGNDAANVALLKRQPGVELGMPLEVGQLHGRGLRLYSLQYEPK